MKTTAKAGCLTAAALAGTIGLSACGGVPPIAGVIIATQITREQCESEYRGWPRQEAQIDLTNAAGTIIARQYDRSRPGSGDTCETGFRFSGVPALETYGIRLATSMTGTRWLTPAEAARPVRINNGPFG